MRSIGFWFNKERSTKVHIEEDNKPMCGSTIGEDMEYKRCATDKGPSWIIQCIPCRKIREEADDN